MQYSTKVRIGAVVGIMLIASVASLLALPFTSSNMQTVHQESIQKMESSEEKMLDFIAHEKSELESKIGGKIKIP